MFFFKCTLINQTIVFLVGHNFSSASRHCMSYTVVNFRYVTFDETKSNHKGMIK